MFDRLNSSRWLWCVLSGLLLVASFPPFSSSTCGWIALVPAWWVLTRSEQVRRTPMRYGYVVGLIYFGGTFWWISNVTAIGTFFLVLYLALYPAMWFLFVARLVPRHGEFLGHSLTQAPAAAALWVTLEWWRSWFITGFNWNELGISQATSIVFRQLAAYGGVHLLSFLLVMVNILWAEGLLDIMKGIGEKRGVRASLPFAAALFVIAVGFALGLENLYQMREPIGQIRFACIQPNIPQIPFEGGTYVDFQNREQAALDKTKELTLQAITAPVRPDLLIWPEATIDEGVFNDRPLNEAVHEICLAYPGYFLLGSQDFDIGNGHKLYNSAYLFGPHGDNYQEYRKTRLVILGEYVPLKSTWIRKQLGVGGIDFTPGPRPEKFVMKNPDTTFAPLICFEDTLPEVADKAAQLDPDFFVTITNDGWYWGWYAAWGVRQHLSHAIFRCIEHDRPMIRCANTGISCVIDQDGIVTDLYRDASGRVIDVGGVFAGELKICAHHVTLYERWGDWIVLLSGLISVILGIRFFWPKTSP